MTFCTVCAAPRSLSLACPNCGALAESAPPPGDSASGSSPHHGVLRMLYLVPLLLVAAFAVVGVQRELANREWLASSYAAAESAAAEGNLVVARDGFASIAGYQDADDRLREIEQLLAPLEQAYAEGLTALEAGDYERAVAELTIVAEQAPDLRDIAFDLGEAHRLFSQELQRGVDEAETARNWSGAEGILRELIALDPAHQEARARLGEMQRLHGPIVLGNKRALWLVSPDGTVDRQLTESLQVIWPVWSPDRSHIAFLASNPDDALGNVSLYMTGLDESEPTRLVDGVSAHAAPVWSPDGSRIAYTSFAGYDPVYETGSIGVRFVDVATGVETNVTGDEYNLAFNPAWAPDSSRLAFVIKHQGIDERPQHSRGDVLVSKLDGSAFENLTNGEVRYVWSVSWSPQGDDLLLFSLFGQTWYEPPSTSIRQLHLPTGEITEIAGLRDEPTMPVWSPTGDAYVYTQDESSIIINRMNGEAVTANAAEALSGEATWSPDGRALLLSPWNSGTQSTLVDLTGAEPSVSTVEIDFDASPPFLSPPQWAPAAPIPPEQNPSLLLPSTPVADVLS